MRKMSMDDSIHHFLTTLHSKRKGVILNSHSRGSLARRYHGYGYDREQVDAMDRGLDLVLHAIPSKNLVYIICSPARTVGFATMKVKSLTVTIKNGG